MSRNDTDRVCWMRRWYSAEKRARSATLSLNTNAPTIATSNSTPTHRNGERRIAPLSVVSAFTSNTLCFVASSTRRPAHAIPVAARNQLRFERHGCSSEPVRPAPSLISRKTLMTLRPPGLAGGACRPFRPLMGKGIDL